MQELLVLGVLPFDNVAGKPAYLHNVGCSNQNTRVQSVGGGIRPKPKNV